MKPKKVTKFVSHQEHEGHKDHQVFIVYASGGSCDSTFIVYASGGYVTRRLLYMPPAAM